MNETRIDVELDESTNILYVTISGSLDEDSHLSQIPKFLERVPNTVREIHFDLGGIEHVNALGTRKWMSFISQLEAQLHLQVEFDNLSETMEEFSAMFRASA